MRRTRKARTAPTESDRRPPWRRWVARRGFAQRQAGPPRPERRGRVTGIPAPPREFGSPPLPLSLARAANEADLADRDITRAPVAVARNDADIEFPALALGGRHGVDRIGDLEHLGHSSAAMGSAGTRGGGYAEKRNRANIGIGRFWRGAHPHVKYARALVGSNVLKLEKHPIRLARRVRSHGLRREAVGHGARRGWRERQCQADWLIADRHLSTVGIEPLSVGTLRHLSRHDCRMGRRDLRRERLKPVRPSELAG